MKPSEILSAKRDEVRAIFARYPVGNPRVFGSVARGDDAEESVIDFVVQPLQGCTLFSLGGLSVDLEDLLGVPINLVTEKQLPSRWSNAALAVAKAI